jgi:hypothetical protein
MMKTGQFVVFMITILLMAPISSGALETSWDRTGCVSISGYDSTGETNSVTLNVDNSDILFVGYDVWQRAEQYSGLMDNETVIDLMQHYEDELLFVMPCPGRDYITVVGMNESFYVEMLIECMYDNNAVVQVTSLEAMSGSNYIDSLKIALSTAMDENTTRGLNVTAWDRCGHAGSSPLRAHLWSYTYTGGSLTFGDSPHRVVLWSSPDASDLLQEVHWEIVTEANITHSVSHEEPDPSTWEHDEIPTQMVMSITQDGELIQVLHEVFPIAADYDLTIYLLGGLIGTAAIVAIVAVVWHRKNMREL